MAVRTSISGYGTRPTDSLWRPFAARTVLKNRKLAFSKVFLKAKSIRKVVVPCGCNTAQFELEINEEKKVSESWSRERVIFSTGQVTFSTDRVIFSTQ